MRGSDLNMIERPYGGCGKCLPGVGRLSRMKLATSSPERQREDVLIAAASVGGHIIGWADEIPRPASVPSAISASSAWNTEPDNPSGDCRLRGPRNKPLTHVQKGANMLLAAERAAIEHAFAHVKNWRILTKLRMSAR